MKKIFTLLCAAVIAVSTMNAEVLLQENFAKANDPIWSGDNVTTAIEAGKWVPVSGTGEVLTLNKEVNLTYTSYASADANSGSVAYAPGMKKIAKSLSSSVSSGSVYLGFLINLSNCEASSMTAKNHFIGFNKNLLPGIENNNYMRVYGQKGENGYKLTVTKYNDISAQTYTNELSYNTTYLVIAEYKFVEGDNNDSCFLYINPVKGAKPAPTYVNVQEGTGGSASKADLTSIESIYLYANNTNKFTGSIDEIKVVTDWSDLWEAGEVPQTPTIIADQSFSFGNVNVNEAANKSLTIKGSNLKGAISIASNNEQLVVSAASVTKEAAEAEEGAAVSLTLTATAAGEGSAKITLSSEDAADKVINVTWNAVVPLPSVTNIAALKTSKAGVEVELKSEPIVIGILDWNIVLQDESGAIVVQDLYDLGSNFWALQIGDKVKGLKSHILESEDFVRAFPTVTIIADVAAASSGNAITPIETNIADMNNYGPAYIKLTQVEFTDTNKDKFAQGWFYIKQGDNTARIQVPENCDIIGEDIPAKADVVGQLVYTTGGIAISSSANLTNRVSRSATAIENIQSKGKAVKVVRNGQLIILRDGKEYNVLGVEK